MREAGSKELVELMKKCWDGRPSERHTFKSRTVSNTAKFVDDNRATLIQSVAEVMAITEHLGDAVHRETYSLILGKATSQEQMRVLYQRALRSGGEEVKAAFYDALKHHQPKLVERLGRISF
ncbi:hypothetical protein EYF80_059050 [Liparis tanakae]|uniref:CARD domain-containing protein n=1 Tax=Liparis tanakae TaxID=230148 RepID=A0A4Z2EPS3_9TELE|nr:hypothetical protein EYF80_059050 [Liparis tanakae]